MSSFSLVDWTAIRWLQTKVGIIFTQPVIVLYSSLVLRLVEVPAQATAVYFCINHYGFTSFYYLLHTYIEYDHLSTVERKYCWIIFYCEAPNIFLIFCNVEPGYWLLIL